MEIKNIEECFRFRLLRKIAPSTEKSEKSLEIAKIRLKEVEEIIKLNNVFDFVILGAYNAMFHAARALLYKDGIQEKSHFAIYIYLKEKYSDKIPINVLNFLNIHRIERHEAIYGIDYKPKKEDAELALKDANIFVNEIEKAFWGEMKIRELEPKDKEKWIVLAKEADGRDKEWAEQRFNSFTGSTKTGK